MHWRFFDNYNNGQEEFFQCSRWMPSFCYTYVNILIWQDEVNIRPRYPLTERWIKLIILQSTAIVKHMMRYSLEQAKMQYTINSHSKTSEFLLVIVSCYIDIYVHVYHYIYISSVSVANSTVFTDKNILLLYFST